MISTMPATRFRRNGALLLALLALALAVPLALGVYRATAVVAYPGGGPDFRTYTLPGLVRFAR